MANIDSVACVFQTAEDKDWRQACMHSVLLSGTNLCMYGRGRLPGEGLREEAGTLQLDMDICLLVGLTSPVHGAVELES